MQYRIQKLYTETPTHAEQHAASEALAREMLSATLGIPPKEVVILRADSGKPFVKGHPVHFNVSHSGDRVLCAVHTAPVGADIQQIVPQYDRVMRRVCTPAEIAYIGDDPARFAQIWTRKEAYAKLTGKGLAIGLKTIVVADENGLFSGINGHAVLTEEHDGYIYSVVWEESNYAT